jgi:uncharacterized surface protein with fasciclin (FAS1) repeats
VQQIEYQTTIFLHLQAVTVEGSKITKFDLSASNGVVHVINKVMTPPAGDIVDLVAGNSDLSTLLAQVKSAGLANALKGDYFHPFDAERSNFVILDPSTVTACKCKYIVV